MAGSGDQAELLRWRLAGGAFGLLGLLTGLALLLIWRRQAGAMVASPSAGTLAALSLVVIVSSNLSRLLWTLRQEGRIALPLTCRRFGGALTVAVVMIGIAITSISGMSWLLRLAFWGVLIAGEMAWLMPWRRRKSLNEKELSPCLNAPKGSGITGMASASNVANLPEVSGDSDLESRLLGGLDQILGNGAIGSGLGDFDDDPDFCDPELESESCGFDENMQQQLTRSRTPEGRDELSGVARSEFAAGQRTSHIDVAFCPPFGSTPEIEAYQLDGPELKITTVRPMTCGCRFELKLAEEPTQPVVVTIAFAISES